MVEASKNEKVEPEMVPLATVALEVGMSVDQLVAGPFKGHVLLDEIGLRCAPAVEVMRFMAERWERKKQHETERARRTEELAAKHPKIVAGAPALEGATPFESMMAAEAASGNFTTPAQDFDELGRESPSFVQEAIDQGRRELDARRRETAARKEAAAAALKKSLQ